MSGGVVCVATQAELDRAVAAGDVACCCKGGSFTASDSATVWAYDSATVRASKWVAIHDHGPRTSLHGGVIITVPHPTTAEEWCEYRGVEVVDGIATLYKAVRDDWRSKNGADYSPGATPEAADWDGGKKECGGGLHFCASPHEAGGFDPAHTRYVACPVRVDEMRAPRTGDMSPAKIKARRVVAPGCVEVDVHGNVLVAS